MAIITLREYARRLGKDPSGLSRRAQNGGFEPAVKVGGVWLIDEDEPYIDRRITSGAYVGKSRHRKKKPD